MTTEKLGPWRRVVIGLLAIGASVGSGGLSAAAQGQVVPTRASVLACLAAIPRQGGVHTFVTIAQAEGCAPGSPCISGITPNEYVANIHRCQGQVRYCQLQRQYNANHHCAPVHYYCKQGPHRRRHLIRVGNARAFEVTGAGLPPLPVVPEDPTFSGTTRDRRGDGGRLTSSTRRQARTRRTGQLGASLPWCGAGCVACVSRFSRRAEFTNSCMAAISAAAATPKSMPLKNSALCASSSVATLRPSTVNGGCSCRKPHPCWLEPIDGDADVVCDSGRRRLV